MADEILLQADGLRKTFQTARRRFPWHRASEGAEVYALDGVTFSLRRGETLGIIGESGCGKSTTARMIVGLARPDGGSLRFKGMDVGSLRAEELQAYRRQVQIVFQDPYEYLNPRMPLRDIVCEPLVINKLAGGDRERSRIAEGYLEQVGLSPAGDFARRYTHELSGGQRQRVAIARALVLHPELLVADEPTSMLDVSVRAGILNLLKGLALDYRMSMIFITHDIATAGYMCDRIAVMYKGRIVEIGNKDDIVRSPVHPYTKALVRVCADLRTFVEERGGLIGEGEVDAFARGGCCCFSDRCVQKAEPCERLEGERLEMTRVGDGHLAACCRER